MLTKLSLYAIKGLCWLSSTPPLYSLIEPIEYIAHPGGLGLGATPRPPDPKKKAKIKKPGGVEKKVSTVVCKMITVLSMDR